MARLYVLTGCRSVLNPTCIYSSILAMFFSGVRFVSMNVQFYINLLSTPPPPIFLKTKDLKHCSQTFAGECLKLKKKDSDAYCSAKRVRCAQNQAKERQKQDHNFAGFRFQHAKG